MTAILISGVVGLVGTLLGTPLLIRYLHAKEYGQFIRQDGPQGHFTKRGTPTMGGLVIIISTVLGYTLANLSQLRTPRASGVLLLFLVVGLILFILWANFLITAWSNAVNLTDGLDGLAAGASAMVFGAYTLIGVWQTNQSCNYGHETMVPTTCYQVRDPRDLAMIAAALMGACFGFLWWNASPAKIFMGDTGSLALGGAVAGLSILTRTEFLAVILGGLFLAEVMSDIIQIVSFKSTGRRVFRMAPLHHHFELGGWTEVNVVIRFWIIAGLCVIAGLGIFYAEYLRQLIFG